MIKTSFFDEWDRKDVIALFETLYQEQAASVKTSNSPQVIFMEGLSGSGKSSYARAYQKEHSEFMYFSIDDLIGRSPDFEGYTPKMNDKLKDVVLLQDLFDFSIYSFLHIQQRAMSERKNIIIDGLGGLRLRQAVKSFKNAGWQVQAVALSAPKRIMDINILSRSLNNKAPNTLIMTNLRKNKKTIDNTLFSLSQFENWGATLQIIDNFSGKKLYDSQYKTHKLPQDIFLQEFSRSLTTEEKKEICVRRDFLIKKLSVFPKEEIQTKLYKNALENSLAQYYLPNFR